MLDHYPEWADTLAKKYLSRTVNQFILHGNVHDLVHLKHEKPEFVRLKHFLGDDFFGARDLVIFYDRSSGIYFRDEESRRDFNSAISASDTITGSDVKNKLPKNPVGAFSVLEKYFRLRLDQQKSVALIIDYAETVVPMNEAGSSGTEDRNALVYLKKWAQDPQFLSADFTTVLLTENLADIHKNLTQHPYTSDISIPLPDEGSRLAFLKKWKAKADFEKISSISREVIATHTAGLGFVRLEGILAGAVENNQQITQESLYQIKKELIEAEAYGLLEFVPTHRSLDDVAGHDAVKKHLRSSVTALQKGRSDVLPMGYLVCGPVGTGKTFLVTCFAGEVGIPMVKLKNFRSQWQGVTEGNLEKILGLLKAMAPVAVMIDEADAYLGNRHATGDSGVSSRVFSQIANFMSDTENRGRIIWFLITARPDLMPIDLKRQGRAEEHIALFPPESIDDRIEVFRAMQKKTGLVLTDEEYVPGHAKKKKNKYTGADFEAICTRAKFLAASKGADSVDSEELEQVFRDFIPPTYPEEMELQTLAAVSECTSTSLLPHRFRTLPREELMEKLKKSKQSVR